MRKSAAIRLCLALGALAFAAGAIGCSSGDEDAAVEAAKEWLAKMDEGHLGECWEQSSSIFRNGMPKADFEQSVSKARAPLGKLISREVRSAQPARSLPGAPRGRYVVILFDSVFEKQKSAVESVTEMFENGQWRVAGFRSR